MGHDDGAGCFLFIAALGLGLGFGFLVGNADADANVCEMLAAERGDTLAIAREVEQCRDHLGNLIVRPEPTP